MLDEDLQVQKVKQDGRWTDEDMRQIRRVNLSQVSGQQTILMTSIINISSNINRGVAATYLGDELRLLELAIHQDHVAILVHFCAAQSRLGCSLGRHGSTTVEYRRAVAVLIMARKIIGLQGFFALSACDPP